MHMITNKIGIKMKRLQDVHKNFNKMKNTNSYELIKTYIIISMLFIAIATSICPTPELLYPCVCEQHFDILCGGHTIYNLSRIFESLSNLDKNFKHFKLFYLNNTAITELPYNIFNGIKFKSIIIENALSLKIINTDTFMSSNSELISFRMWSTPNDTKVSLYSIFDVINGMVNIESVNIIDKSIDTIPANAFGQLNRLKHLQLNANIKLIGSNAFYDLNCIELINLDENPLELIDDSAFNLRDKGTDSMLHLSLNSVSTLTSDIFSSHTFADIRRPFILFLRTDSALKHLDEHVFSTVLANNNSINLWGTQLVCDCRAFWLYKNPKLYQRLLVDEKCVDGYSVFASRQSYSNCTSNTSV